MPNCVQKFLNVWHHNWFSRQGLGRCRHCSYDLLAWPVMWNRMWVYAFERTQARIIIALLRPGVFENAMNAPIRVVNVRFRCARFSGGSRSHAVAMAAEFEWNVCGSSVFLCCAGISRMLVMFDAIGVAVRPLYIYPGHQTSFPQTWGPSKVISKPNVWILSLNDVKN